MNMSKVLSQNSIISPYSNMNDLHSLLSVELASWGKLSTESTFFSEI